ncbi:MAG: response regulator [Lachnospiraceae bacterium]|nr:response regulator [Lachnospiraceae bacterium]
MIKVFLVEDEFVVREGIKKTIDWEAHGYEFCGEAGDGELAYPLIQKLKPDIVITDIKMPFMDGLALSKLIKKEMPWIEIMILSGFEEFEYAKEGIKLGIAQYLTKPINGTDLLREIDAVAEKIREKARERAIREKYIKEMKEGYAKERKDLFHDLVTGSKSMAELLEHAGKLEIDLSAIWYNILLFKMQPVKQGHDEYSNRLIEIEKQIAELAESRELLLFQRELEGVAFLFRADSEEELKEKQKDLINELEHLLADDKEIRYFGGVGVAVNRMSELPLCFEKASHVFAHRYFVKESVVLQPEEAEDSLAVPREDFSLSEVNPKHMDRSKIRDFLKMGQKEEVIYFVEEFFKAMGSGALSSTIFRQYVIMDVYFCVTEFLEELQIPRDKIDVPDVSAESMQSEKSMVAYVVEIMKSALELRENAASNRYRNVLDEVIGYIEKHYAEEELSLNVLASHVNFSPNHLSMIFSQQTGKSFIKYLTEYRMQKAKELLRCTGKRSSEISVEVGYKDAHYFSYLFKKTQGMTPTQYRGGKNAEGDE